ncbi:hypothetical protein HG530_004380 [Fusarium avenaceum]|nr:hypothetical protein HG530_004380 [Fusarium avenaceum]
MTELFVHIRARDLYPPQGEVRSAIVEAKSRQDDVETTNIAEEFVISMVIQSLYKKVSETKSAITRSKNANRDKSSLSQFATRTLEHNLELYSDLKEVMDRVKIGEKPLKESLQLSNISLRNFTARHFKISLMSLLVPIAHFSPKAWVIVGVIAQKPAHMSMKHDLGPGKTTPKPSTLQKKTSLLHRVVEGGARHSTLSMNMRAHGDVGKPANNLCYNNIMLWRHKYGTEARGCVTRYFGVVVLDPDIAGAFPDIGEPFSLYLGANYANHPMPFAVLTAEQSNAVAVSFIHDFRLGEYKARNTRQNVNQEINAIVGDDGRVTYLQEQLEPNALQSFLNVTARAIFAVLRKPSEAAIIESLNDVEVQRYITSVNTAQELRRDQFDSDDQWFAGLLKWVVEFGGPTRPGKEPDLGTEYRAKRIHCPMVRVPM